jgi:hypothetical protein
MTTDEGAINSIDNIEGNLHSEPINGSNSLD